MYTKKQITVFKRVLAVDKRTDKQMIGKNGVYISSPFYGFRLGAGAKVDGLDSTDQTTFPATVDRIMDTEHAADYPLPTRAEVKQFIAENGLKRNKPGRKAMDIGGGHFFNPFYLLDVYDVFGDAELFPFYQSTGMGWRAEYGWKSPLIIKTWGYESAYIMPVNPNK